MLKFWKMDGAGNDFIMLDNRNATIELNAEQIATLCDRHHGIGADGLMLLEKDPQNTNGYFMKYFNSNGSHADMCGNGARCFAKFLNLRVPEKIKNGVLNFDSDAGEVKAKFLGDQVQISLETPKDIRLNIPLSLGSEKIQAHHINTGVPHVVTFWKQDKQIDVQGLGAKIRYHENFSPAGANVNFIKIIQKDLPLLEIRTYERGVESETLACGTGVIAAGAIYRLLNGGDGEVSVKVKDSSILKVDFTYNSSELKISEVRLTGPAQLNFIGTWEKEF